MANVARRGFLALIGAAPIALPVAAKEAAAKMGMGSVLSGAASYGGGSALDVGYPKAGTALKGDGSILGYLRAELRNLTEERNVSEIRRRVLRNGEARVLDADLASMRSTSPSVAYHIQIERCVARNVERERMSLLDRIQSATACASG